MNILGQIQKISVEINASLKDDFVGLKHFEIKLPAEFPSGSRHLISIGCTKCYKDFSFSFFDKSFFDKTTRADIHHFRDVVLLKEIGTLFNLKDKCEIEEDGKYMFYNMSFTGKYKSVADIAGFHCPHCQSKYMMSYACYEEENEKAPEPDIVYIDKILMVDMDFGELKGML